VDTQTDREWSVFLAGQALVADKTLRKRCCWSRTSAISCARPLFDPGERAKVVIFSVTEGEDKPLKYPDMFGAASVMLLSKTDLLPHLRSMSSGLSRTRAPSTGGSWYCRSRRVLARGWGPGTGG
jgi:hypothetical protein